MDNINLNLVKKNYDGWICQVLNSDLINIGGLVLTHDIIKDLILPTSEDFILRYYKKSHLLIASSTGGINKKYCALDIEYSMWNCLICKKTSYITQAKCFCEKQSVCWEPLKPKIKGLLFSDEMNFQYHFNNDEINIIL